MHGNSQMVIEQKNREVVDLWNNLSINSSVTKFLSQKLINVGGRSMWRGGCMGGFTVCM